MHQQTKCQILVHVTAAYVTSAPQAPRRRPGAAKPQLAVHVHHNSMFCLTASHSKLRATPKFFGPVFLGSSPLLLCFPPITGRKPVMWQVLSPSREFTGLGGGFTRNGHPGPKVKFTTGTARKICALIYHRFPKPKLLGNFTTLFKCSFHSQKKV